MLKFALLSTINSEDSVKKFVQKMCPPLGFFYIEGYLKKYLPEVSVFISSEPDEVLIWEPDIIGVSSVTENYRIAEKTIHELSLKTQVPIIMGGVHLSTLPEQLPRECKLGVLGEGEVTILELLKIYLSYSDFKEEQLKTVKGIVYRDGDGKINITEKRPYLDPLDLVPFPERHFIDPLGISHMISSRGCPYKCIFCSTSKFWNCFRAHSAEYVADEIKTVIERVNPPHIKFFDDLFIVSKERLYKLLSIIKKENLKPEYGFSCFARAELLDREMVTILRDIGFNGVAIGIESGSPEVLKRLKGQATIEINQRALDLCKEFDINTTCSFVIGTPGETKEDLQKTCEFIINNEDKITEIEICPIVPFPGTELWDYAEKRNLVSLDMDWGLLEDYSIFTQYDPESYIYLNEDMSFDDFNEYCMKFLEIYKHFCSKSNRVFGEIIYNSNRSRREQQ